MKKTYIKHLVRCKCILSHLRRISDAPLHKFIAFSEIEEDGTMIPSFAQCQNCGVVHKVIEVNTSEILKKEDLPSLLTIEEIKTNLPEQLVAMLDLYQLDLHVWQEVRWILENEDWGKGVIVAKDKADGLVSGKMLQILGKSLWRMISFSSEDITEV